MILPQMYMDLGIWAQQLEGVVAAAAGRLRVTFADERSLGSAAARGTGYDSLMGNAKQGDLLDLHRIGHWAVGTVQMAGSSMVGADILADKDSRSQIPLLAMAY